MDVKPVTTPHLDLDHLHLADKDFQSKDTSAYTLLKIHFWSKDKYLNHTDALAFGSPICPNTSFHKYMSFLILSICAMLVTFLAKEL